MPDKRTFIPPTPVIGFTAGTIGKRSSAPSSAPSRAVPRELTKFPRASQQPNRPGPALKPRMVDEETEKAELREAAIMLYTRTLLSQVAQVPLDQVHRLIDNGL